MERREPTFAPGSAAGDEIAWLPLPEEETAWTPGIVLKVSNNKTKIMPIILAAFFMVPSYLWTNEHIIALKMPYVNATSV
jgi:hypothetical protein